MALSISALLFQQRRFLFCFSFTFLSERERLSEQVLI
jgi:hypothetical protein